MKIGIQCCDIWLDLSENTTCNGLQSKKKKKKKTVIEHEEHSEQVEEYKGE